MRIKIDNNKYILVEKIAFAIKENNIKEEISITVADENNQPIQDIALVRKSESKEKENNVEVLVWNDCNDEDFTHKFDIDLYEESEEI